MADNYTPRVKALLRASGCTFVRHGKGDHEIWHSPVNGRRFMIDSHIKVAPLGQLHVEASRLAESVLTALR